eukprot:TRINITY_DN1498_c0_g2_i4.p1 TRINITY_DN1498_c0_g2~~TRINITY_DN1498_c0_g2_i4.p1  ORF type:complete len:2306 (-),score=584.47 TRINITY_DN1498_c0_g2_i4:5005-11922(-)
MEEGILRREPSFAISASSSSSSIAQTEDPAFFDVEIVSQTKNVDVLIPSTLTPWQDYNEVVIACTSSGIRAFDTRNHLITVKERGDAGNTTPSTYRCTYLGTDQKLIISRDQYVKIFKTDSEIVLDSIAITKESLEKELPVDIDFADDNRLRIFVTPQQALGLTNELENADILSSLEKETLDDLKEVTEQLKESLQRLYDSPAPNKVLEWSTCSFEMPYKQLKSSFTSLLSVFGNDVLDHTRSSVQAVVEILKRVAKACGDPAYAESTKKCYESEYCRLNTFKKWTRSKNPSAVPTRLAKSGLYFQPSSDTDSQSEDDDSVGEDKCVCFSCSTSLADWENQSTGNPVEAHLMKHPTCAFLRGQDLTNIPLASTLQSLPFKKYGNTSETASITHLVSSDNSSLFASVCADSGKVVVWDTSLRLKEFASFNCLDGKEGRFENGTLMPLFKAGEKKPVRWIEWVTSDIRVELKDANSLGLDPYKTDNAVVSDIQFGMPCVFFPHYNKTFMCRSYEIIPVKPRLNDKVKILKGDSRGKNGTLTYISSQKARVALADGTIVEVDNLSVALLAEETCPTESYDLSHGCVFVAQIWNESTKKTTLQFWDCQADEAGLVRSLELEGTLSSSIKRIQFPHRFYAVQEISPGSPKIITIEYNYTTKTPEVTSEYDTKMLHGGSVVDWTLLRMPQFKTEAFAILHSGGRIFLLNCDDPQIELSEPIITRVPLAKIVSFNQSKFIAYSTAESSLVTYELKLSAKQQLRDAVPINEITLTNLLPLKTVDHDLIFFVAFPPPNVEAVDCTGYVASWEIPYLDEEDEDEDEEKITEEKEADSDSDDDDEEENFEQTNDEDAEKGEGEVSASPKIVKPPAELPPKRPATAQDQPLVVRSGMSAAVTTLQEDGSYLITRDFPFEIELDASSPVTRISLTFSFDGDTTEETKTPSPEEINQGVSSYSISLSYYDQATSTWKNKFDHTLLSSLARKEASNPCDVVANLNFDITAQYLLLTVHNKVIIEKNSPKYQGKQLNVFGMTVYGSNAPQKDSNRRSLLFESSEFQLSLLQACQNAATPKELRDTCLELLWNVWNSGYDTQHLAKALNLHAFILQNFVLASASTATLAGRLFLDIIKRMDTQFKHSVLQQCLDLLNVVSSRCRSSGGMDQFFSIITSCWDFTDISVTPKAIESLTAALRSVGEKLYDSRSPFYNLLRTFYSLYGFPLELDLFQSKPTELEKYTSQTRLPIAFPFKSPEATPDVKNSKVRFNYIHKPDNWVIIDFGSCCLLTDFEIYWKTDYNNTHTLITVDSWLDNEINSKLLISQELEPSTDLTKEDSNLVLHNGSTVCRYLRVVVKPYHPNSYEAATMTVKAYGIQSYIVPSASSWNQLQEQIHNEEEQRHNISSEFAAKRRALTTSVETININSPTDFMRHKAAVTAAYNECMKLQMDEHQIIRKLKRLHSMKDSLRPVTSSLKDSGMEEPDEIKQDHAQLDRWTRVAELYLSLLTKAKKANLTDQTLVSQDIIEEFFRNFCIYGTPSLRKQATSWLKLHLEQWVSFPSEMLSKYFASKNYSMDPTKVFPQQDVYVVLKDVILGNGDCRYACVNDLLGLLSELTHHRGEIAKATPMDLSLVSWVLLLLSNTVDLNATSDIVHPGSKCAGCQMFPIHGVRYRCVNCVDCDLCEKCETERTNHDSTHLFLKISKPLPLYPPKPTNQPADKLLPVMYPKSPAPNASTGTATATATATPTPATNNTHDVVCDGCGKKSIVGIRYKCVNCDEFNFCEECEGKVEHFPHHMFLRIRYPLPPQTLPEQGTTTPNPKALIPNHQSLLPFVLHRSIYPSSPAITRSIRKSDDRLRTSTEDVTDHPEEVNHVEEALKSIFSLLSSDQPLSREIIYLGTRLISGLAPQFTIQDVYAAIFTHPKFKEFIRRISTFSDAFLRSSVLTMMETLCKDHTYQRPDEKLSVDYVKKVLRAKFDIMLEAPNLSEESANFILELLLIVSPASDKDQKSSNQTKDEKTEVDKTPLTHAKTAATHIWAEGQKIFKPLFTGDDVAPVLNYVACSKLTLSSAKAWSMAFKLLHLSGPKKLLHSDVLLRVFLTAITSPFEVQVILRPNFFALVELLLAQSDSEHLRKGLMSLLTESLNTALKEEDPELYRSLTTSFHASLKKSAPTADIFKGQLDPILKEVGAALRDCARTKKSKPILLATVELVNTILGFPAVVSELKTLVPLSLQENTADEKSYTFRMLEWIASVEAAALPLPASPGAKDYNALQAEIEKTILLLAENESIALHLISFSVLKKTPTSSRLAELLSKYETR